MKHVVLRLPGPLRRPLGLVAGAAGATGLAAAEYLLRRPLPQTRGQLVVAGLQRSVEIARDRWGVPHIRAETQVDAFFGQGFCHGQDRLWQMDVSRRVARGQLAEVFGPDALLLDQFSRRYGLARAAQREWDGLGTDERDVLLAYTAGVNAAIARSNSRVGLPIEYRLLRFKPREWEPLDSLAFGRFFAATQSPNWESELVRSRLIARLGYAATALLEGALWDPESGAVPHLADWGASQGGSTGASGIPGGIVASNAWAVAPRRSTTGNALLANDPHVHPSLPAAFYEAHLIGGGELNVVGATIPGTPGVIIGHNRYIAWGVTASMADVQDLYVERVDPTHPHRTEYSGRWEPGTVLRESIRVRGQSKPHVEEVFVTARHGPTITPTPLLPDEHRTMALRSVVLEAPEQLRPLLLLNRATDWESFREAARVWRTPSLTLIYADAQGNVGRQTVGSVPVRARGEGLVPSPGWTGRHEWTGQVAFDDLPHAYNPATGYVATANQEPDDAPFLGREFPSQARYRRITQVLESRARHSAVDFGALQSDVLNVQGKAVADLLARHLATRDPLEVRALHELRRWDGRTVAASVGATIYDAFRRHLARTIAGGDPEDVADVLQGRGLHPVFAPLTSFYHRQSDLTLAWLTRWVEEGADGQAVPEAFSRAVQELRQKLGGDVSRWQWRRVHVLTLRHVLSARRPLGKVFDLGPFPIPGDGDTVRASGSRPGERDASGLTAGYRLIVDCGDWDASVACLLGGQSGHRASPHYGDQVSLWLRVSYHPLPFTRPAVDRFTQHTLTLTPEEKSR